MPLPDPQRLKKIDRLIADLDARDFATRQKAGDELAALGEEVEAALRKAVDAKPSLELRRPWKRCSRS